ncbi:MAG: hypothetical protein NZL89_02665 [Leptospiraceae bacterium]|nr:hypothetical protein [Leptospiraceae bacterium]
MEQTVNNIVSFGIGAYETLRAAAEELLKNLEKEVNELIAAGANVQTEEAVKIRAAATDAAQQLGALIEQAKLRYGEWNSKVQQLAGELKSRAEELLAKLPGTKVQAA